MKIKLDQLRIVFLFIVTLALLGLFSSTFAKVELHSFESPEQKQLYQKLSEQLRCLVCQNQNLADSNAELAQDMRQKTYEMVVANQSEKSIIDYWVTRYGDFVLYNPPFKSSTYILWLGPFFLLLFAVIIAIKLSKRNKQIDQPQPQDQQDHAAVKELLNK